ncbi:hypothetical protein ACFL6I_20870 [candidate division KSB1 bacterium]
MLLNFLFWLILIYLLFRVMVKYLFPYLLRWYLKRFQNKFYEQNPHLKKEQNKKDTKVHIKRPGSRKINTDTIGEYVDYEEVDEK